MGKATTLRKITLSVALSSMAPVAFACGGSSSSSGPPNATSACDTLFAAENSLYACEGTPLPASEVSRLLPQFEAECATTLALPGTSLTPAFLTSCAQDIAAAHCGALDSSTCNLPPGTLAAGAPCVDESQCASSQCNFMAQDDGGAFTESACGTCAATIAIGQPCGGATTAVCAPGSACTEPSTSPTCQAITHGAAGSPCDLNVSQCDSGLYCDFSTMACVPPAPLGAPCSAAALCASPLVCAASVCSNGAAVGESCDATNVCAVGLTCDATSAKCVAVAWASAGQPCGAEAQCLVGGCDSGSDSTGVCPTVIANGQPCSNDEISTCDTYSNCIDGVCAVADSAVCK
jgi:hypothetical protein